MDRAMPPCRGWFRPPRGWFRPPRGWLGPLEGWLGPLVAGSDLLEYCFGLSDLFGPLRAARDTLRQVLLERDCIRTRSVNLEFAIYHHVVADRYTYAP